MSGVMSGGPRVKIEDVRCLEREVRLRLPFRFGAATVTRSTQAVVSLTLALEDGRTATGVAAEILAAKWFDKDPALTDAQNVQQLRQALALAVTLYGAQGWSTPFGLYACSYHDQLRKGAELGLTPLAAGFGPALLDRAVLDALGRAADMSFAQIIASNRAAIEVRDALVPDLAGFDVDRFLAALRPARTIAVRHTIGLLDPLVAADQRPQERRDDGLPETLQEVVHTYAPRYFKLKLCGEPAADLERLERIAAVLDAAGGDYRVTLDGNEQFAHGDAIALLWRRARESRRLARLTAATLFIEQPIPRAATLATSVAELARHIPLIIDESDGDLAAFPAALALGYSGVSSKSCKGLYKSLLNAARVCRRNAGAGQGRLFMTGEDLTTLAGASVQQDLALAALLGIGHVERNGHHFVDGMAFAPVREQAAFTRAHPDLYTFAAGTARLRIADGRLGLGSLACAGFAVAAAMDLAAMRSMPAPPETALRTPHTPAGALQEAP
jgi:L-alanine-DL-glutamate epimerase-like enolase superfamily enzyme